ncbi:MAG: DUF1847 domain-containing protein [Coprococcus sp.]
MKYSCAYCQKKACHHNEPEKAPGNCPTIRENDRLDKITELYKDEENYKIANAAARIVMEQYGTKTRVQEIIDFCHEMGYQKLGLAFCVGLLKEARIFTQILEKHGFDVESVICKLGSVNRDTIGIENCDVPMCNPIAQAEFLNGQHTDFNIVLGLCVGHDTLFFKYSEAPVTVLAVKDRVLAHNPLGAIYLADSYYSSKL